MEDFNTDILYPFKITEFNYYIQAWANTRKTLVKNLEEVPVNLFNQRHKDGSWSASEVAEHLSLSQEKFARAIPLVLRGKIGVQTESGKTADYKSIYSNFEIHKKTKNPDGVSPSGEIGKNDTLKNLERSMTLFIKNTSERTLDDLRGKSIPQQEFGLLNLVDYTWVLILHEIHHGILLKRKFIPEI